MNLMAKRAAAICAVLFCSSLATAQPQGEVLWSFEGNDGIYSLVTIPDINGDNRPEVVAATYYGAYPSDPRKLYCLSGADGDTIWVSRTAYGTWGNKGLDASPDLNGDGRGDVLLGTAGTYIPPGRSIVAVSGLDGTNIWVNSPYPGDTWGWVYAVRSFVDIDRDSVPEALGGTGGIVEDRSGHVVLISGRRGTTIWTFRVPLDGCQSVAPFVDINRDLVPDVLVAAGGNSLDNNVYCASGVNGAQLWSSQRGASVSDVERIRDVNRSGVDDCIGGGWDYKVYCLEGATGAQVWQAQPATNRVIMEVVPIRDVNGDSIDDVVVGSWDSNVHVLSGATGATLWSGAVGADVWAVDTLADISGDGVPEVIAGCLGNGSGSVRVFSGSSGQTLWYYDFAERVYDVTGACDLDGDGRPEVLVGLQDQGRMTDHVYCLSAPGVWACEPSPTGLGARPLATVRSARLFADPNLSGQLSVRCYDAAGRLCSAVVMRAGESVALDKLAKAHGTIFLSCRSGSRMTVLKAQLP